MMEADPIAPYITCVDYCAKPIFDPMTDHDKDCGAPLAERARIERELRALKIRTSADAIANASEILGAVLAATSSTRKMTSLSTTPRRDTRACGW